MINIFNFFNKKIKFTTIVLVTITIFNINFGLANQTSLDVLPKSSSSNLKDYKGKTTPEALIKGNSPSALDHELLKMFSSEFPYSLCATEGIPPILCGKISPLNLDFTCTNYALKTINHINKDNILNDMAMFRLAYPYIYDSANPSKLFTTSTSWITAWNDNSYYQTALMMKNPRDYKNINIFDCLRQIFTNIPWNNKSKLGTFINDFTHLINKSLPIKYNAISKNNIMTEEPYKYALEHLACQAIMGNHLYPVQAYDTDNNFPIAKAKNDQFKRFFTINYLGHSKWRLLNIPLDEPIEYAHKKIKFIIDNLITFNKANHKALETNNIKFLNLINPELMLLPYASKNQKNSLWDAIKNFHNLNKSNYSNRHTNAPAYKLYPGLGTKLSIAIPFFASFNKNNSLHSSYSHLNTNIINNSVFNLNSDNSEAAFWLVTLYIWPKLSAFTEETLNLSLEYFDIFIDYGAPVILKYQSQNSTVAGLQNLSGLNLTLSANWDNRSLSYTPGTNDTRFSKAYYYTYNQAKLRGINKVSPFAIRGNSLNVDRPDILNLGVLALNICEPIVNLNNFN